jgi:membrane protein implicated in regulation of membrane protease activity
LIGTVAGSVGAAFLGAGYLVFRASRRKFSTGQAGLIEQVGEVLEPFGNSADAEKVGRVRVMGELWKATLAESSVDAVEVGQQIEVVSVERGMQLLVKPRGKNN